MFSLRLDFVAHGVAVVGIHSDGRLPLRRRLSFGRAASCDVHFRNAMLAGHVNFVIHLREDRAFLMSNYSHGAVRINGTEASPSEPTELSPGTVIEPMDVSTGAPAARLVVVAD